MGQHISSYRDKITEQFHQVKGDASELDFHQVGYIAQPRSRFYVNVKKLGLYWLADEDKNGRYSLTDLLSLLETADSFREHLEDVVEFNASLIFMSYFRCYASLLLLKHLRTQGREDVLTWLYKLVEAPCPEPPRMVNNVRYWPGQITTSLYMLSGRDVVRDSVEDYLAFQQKVIKAAQDNPPLQLGAGTAVDDLWVPQDVLDTFFNGMLDGFLTAATNLEQLSEMDLITLADMMGDPSLHPLHAHLAPGLELPSSGDVGSAVGSFPMHGNGLHGNGHGNGSGSGNEAALRTAAEALHPESQQRALG